MPAPLLSETIVCGKSAASMATMEGVTKPGQPRNLIIRIRIFYREDFVLYGQTLRSSRTRLLRRSPRESLIP